MRRLVIQTPDVEALLNVSAGRARTIIREIKKTVGKDKHQPVSIREFSVHIGLEYEDVLNEVNGTKKAS
tara:strand:- start:3405 stop:3611 length:207 start_codon:yes stop_codon:yes gene_type:complete